MMEPLRSVAKADGRYRLQAYQFLLDALETTVKMAEREGTSGHDKHVSGKELLEGMRVHATELFGPLAAQVWRSWGVHETADWGRIVFNLVDHEMLRRQDTDSIEDFDDGYDFDEAFVASYTPALPAELDAAPRPPIGPGGAPAPDGDPGA